VPGAQKLVARQRIWRGISEAFEVNRLAAGPTTASCSPCHVYGNPLMHGTQFAPSSDGLTFGLWGGALGCVASHSDSRWLEGRNEGLFLSFIVGSRKSVFLYGLIRGRVRRRPSSHYSALLGMVLANSSGLDFTRRRSSTFRVPHPLPRLV